MLRQNIFLNFILTENSLVFIVNFRKVIFLKNTIINKNFEYNFKEN